MLYQCFSQALISTLPDLCSFLEAPAACADVLYRQPPPLLNDCYPRLCEPGQQPHINNNNRYVCFHLYPSVTLPGAATLTWLTCSHCHGKAITGAAGGLCTATGQPSYPAALVHTHLHQINACPLIQAGPLSDPSQHRCSRQNRAPT